MPDTQIEILKHSPAGKVPVRHDGDVTLWESLAICEYLAEKYPQRNLWPTDPVARAYARVIACEMRAGFAPLRQHMNMNCRKHLPGKGRTLEVLRDIERVCAIWNDSRARFGDGGDFLFGQFSIADAMFAPVVLRFVTYVVDLDPVSAAYVQAITTLPAMQQGLAEAAAETEVTTQYEHGT